MGGSMVTTAVLAVTLAAGAALAQQGDFTATRDTRVDDFAYGPAAGDWEFTLGGGGATSQDIDNTDANVDVSVGYFLTDEWMVAIRQSLSFNDQGESNLNGSTRAALDYHFDLGRWQPFVGVNAGGVYGDNVEDTFAAGLEAGVKFYVKEETFLFFRGEYQWFFDDGDEADDTFDDGSFIYTFGIGFNF